MFILDVKLPKILSSVCLFLCLEFNQVVDIISCVLQDMKRPFTPMKQLDMDQVIADIVDKINK